MVFSVPGWYFVVPGMVVERFPQGALCSLRRFSFPDGCFLSPLLARCCGGGGAGYCFAGGLAGKLDDKFDGLFKRFGGYNKIMSSIGFRFATLSKRLWIPGGINFLLMSMYLVGKENTQGRKNTPP